MLHLAAKTTPKTEIRIDFSLYRLIGNENNWLQTFESSKGEVW